MLSPVLMWNKIGRIVIKLSKRLNVTLFFIHLKCVIECMMKKKNYIHLVMTTLLMKL